MTIPSYLKKGDTIGITCPAGYMYADKAQTCIETLQQWGYQVMVGKTLGSKSKNYFSGNDETRLNELQAMLDDERIKAILCGRGGYGISRIIDQIDFTRFKKNPKWIIGFSDITLLHAHINRNFKIATIRRVLFTDPLWNFFSHCSWGEIGRVGAMPVSIRVDWLGWGLFSNGGIGGKNCICFV
jgi:muramoyltetrapeptide carboxypeptidase LdcA involved in peptidoglycan recycling